MTPQGMWELTEFKKVVLGLGVKWWMIVNTNEHTKETRKGLFLAQLKSIHNLRQLKASVHLSPLSHLHNLNRKEHKFNRDSRVGRDTEGKNSVLS